MNKLYERQVAMNFDEQIMQSFDRFLNNKYKVKINQKIAFAVIGSQLSFFLIQYLNYGNING